MRRRWHRRPLSPKGKVMQLVVERGAFRFMSADRAKELYDKISPRLTVTIAAEREYLAETDVRPIGEYPLGTESICGPVCRWKPPEETAHRPTFAQFLGIYRIKLTDL